MVLYCDTVILSDQSKQKQNRHHPPTRETKDLMLIQNNNRQNIANASQQAPSVPFKSSASFVLASKDENRETTFGQTKSANQSNTKSANKTKSIGTKKLGNRTKQSKENQAFLAKEKQVHFNQSQCIFCSSDTTLPDRKSLKTQASFAFGSTLDDRRKSLVQVKASTSTSIQPFDHSKLFPANSSSTVSSPVKELVAKHSKTGHETQKCVSSFSLTKSSGQGVLGKCECVATKAPATTSQDGVSNDTEIIKFQEHVNCKDCGAYAFRTQGKESKYCFALKLDEDRQKVDISPQQILHQMKASAAEQQSWTRNHDYSPNWFTTRGEMLQLIIEVGDCLKQSQLTIHLAVNYMDRFLAAKKTLHRNVSDQNIRLFLFKDHSLDAVAVTCLLLASKFDEIDDNIPLIEEFKRSHAVIKQSLSQESSSKKVWKHLSYSEIKSCELSLLNIFNWNLNTLTPLHFIHSYLFQGVVFSDDQLAQQDTMSSHGNQQPDKKTLQKVKRYIDYFALQSLKQHFMLTKQFSIDAIAVAIVRGARKASKIETEWNEQALHSITGVSMAQSQECFNTLYKIFDSSFECKPAQPLQLQVFLPQSEQAEAEKFALLEVPLEDNKGKNHSSNQHSALNGVLSTGCASNDNSGTLELNNSRQKISENSHHEHMALSVEVLENSNSDASEQEEDLKQVEQADMPVQEQDSPRDNQESSGADFSTLSQDRGQTVPLTKKVEPSKVGYNKTNEILPLQSLQLEPTEVIARSRNQVQDYQEVKAENTQAKSVVLQTVEPLKEFRCSFARPDGPIQVFKQASKDVQELKLFSTTSRRSSSVTKGLFRQRSTSQNSSRYGFNLQPITIKQVAPQAEEEAGLKVFKCSERQEMTEDSLSSFHQQSEDFRHKSSSPEVIMSCKPHKFKTINVNSKSSRVVPQREPVKSQDKKKRDNSFISKNKSFVAGKMVTYQSRLKRNASSNAVSIYNQGNEGEKCKLFNESTSSNAKNCSVTQSSQVGSKMTGTTEIEKSTPNSSSRGRSKEKYDCQREVRFSKNSEIINQEPAVSQTINASTGCANQREQNFIQKNIIYINKLNQKAKDKKQTNQISRTNSVSQLSNLTFRKQQSVIDRQPADQLKGSFVQANRKLAKQVSESVGKQMDRGQIKYEIRSRETSQTPTVSGTSEKSHRFQMQSHKMLQLRAESACDENLQGTQAVISSNKFNASSKLSVVLRGEQKREVNASFKIAHPDNFFSDTFSCTKVNSNSANI